VKFPNYPRALIPSPSPSPRRRRRPPWSQVRALFLPCVESNTGPTRLLAGVLSVYGGFVFGIGSKGCDLRKLQGILAQKWFFSFASSYLAIFWYYRRGPGD
jgi:hypothetical protein